jgi:hypothetical protein
VGHQIIRQPDGKLAVFSSVVDDWILFDASPEELLDYYAGKAAAAARRDTQQVLDAVLAGTPREVYHQFAMTFEEADASAQTRLAETRRRVIAKEEAADGEEG